MRTYEITPPFTLAASSVGITLTDSSVAPIPNPDPLPDPCDYNTTLRHRVVDFHFGCAKGIHFISGKDGGETPFTLTAPAAKGATSFLLTGTMPGAAQLLVLLGADGMFYTTASLSVSGNVCNLCDPLPCDVAAGQNVWSFWDNNAHPNSKGYAAIADYALNQDMSVWRKVWSGPPSFMGPSSIGVAPYDSRMNSGSANSGNGWAVTPSGAGGGAVWRTVLPAVGNYRLSFECTKSAEGSADVMLSVVCGGVEVKSYAINTFTVGRHDVDFYATGPVEIKMTRQSVAFYCSNMTILTKEKNGLGSLNRGRHMVLGDSWVYDPVGIAARLTARLPLATVMKSGVGGNKASDILARFDADVGSLEPFDYVWIMVGTNDIAAGITPDDFTKNLFSIINKVQALGAVPIVFTPYTGCTDIPARIDTARCYMAFVPYNW